MAKLIMMKNKTIYIILILLVLFNFNLIAQELLPAEKTGSWTDRALYISGEDILFAGHVAISDGNELLSSVVYIELISPENQKINQIKLPINEHSFSGKITIPEDVLSGYYYLRSYTKWMRNGAPEDYHYTLIKIVNPFLQDVLLVNDSQLLEKSYSKAKISEFPLSAKTQYQTAEKINISIEEQSSVIKDPSLSIIPNGSQSFSINKMKSLVDYYIDIKYQAETRGLSLSGVILVNDSISAYHKLNVHVLGKKDFISVLCNENGQFHVALPEAYDEKELFLIAASSDRASVKIQIDQDFCTKEINIPTPRFAIEDSEKEVLLKMAKQQQIRSALGEEEAEMLDSITRPAFYGSVFKTIDLDFYVPLDSLQQYFTDIPSWVVVKKKKGKRSLYVFSQQSGVSIYPSLLMVDWVPIDDADRVLAMNPSAVKQVEIINQSYVHGNQIYGGIIHVKTRKGNFGNLKFPESGQYLNYKFYSSRWSTIKHQDKFSNTTFWEFEPIKNENGNYIMQAPLFSGDYLIQLQGIDNQGNLLQYLQAIQVIK